jgi:hypothetical protein
MAGNSKNVVAVVKWRCERQNVVAALLFICCPSLGAYPVLALSLACYIQLPVRVIENALAQALQDASMLGWRTSSTPTGFQSQNNAKISPFVKNVHINPGCMIERCVSVLRGKCGAVLNLPSP